jgi:DNA-binding PadR family transcriptional regulator
MMQETEQRYGPKMTEAQMQDKDIPRELLARELLPIIVEYITKTNSRYRGNEFTSSQLAKTVVTITQLEKTRFPVIHRIVKEILRKWEDEGICTRIATTKYSRCRKTKDTYRFTNEGLTELKKQSIEDTMETIRKSELTTTPIMRTRDYIVKDRFEELLNSIMRTPQPAEDDET